MISSIDQELILQVLWRVEVFARWLISVASSLKEKKIIREFQNPVSTLKYRKNCTFTFCLEGGMLLKSDFVTKSKGVP